MKSESFASPQRRTIIYLTILISVAVVGFRLFEMQILNSESYELKSSDNSIKQVVVSPLRGIFYDRNMEVLVGNSPAYILRIIPSDYDKKLNNLLEKVIDADSGFISEVLDKNKHFSKYLPVKIKKGIDFNVVAWIEENSENLPGVDYIIEMHRNYPAGVSGSHMFGYIKEISAKQLETEKEHYRQGDNVGCNGIEKTYEKNLRGIKGNRFILVDSKRKKIGSYKKGDNDHPPLKGQDLVLTIDADVQRVAEEEFKGKRGALVAIEPSTGEILALLSAPDYDLNQFSYLTSKDFLSQLYNDPEKPLFNRATMSVKPPGSTFKVLEAITALALGSITPSTTFFCGGGITYGRFFRCHGSHGRVNVIKAIEKSCNTFFYQLIYKIGLEPWKQYAEMFGFNNKTNIDIGEESKGLIPDEKYYERIYGEKWPRSIMASLGIGQGEVSVTPIQLALYAALLANNGKTFEPHLVKGYFDETTNKLVRYKFKERNVDIEKKYFDFVKEGMFLVVNGKGTATHIRSEDFEICGKTGTSQNPHGKDHALFVGFAPYKDPQIAFAIVVENVGFGGTHAAPIAKKIVEVYLNKLKRNTSKLDESITQVESRDLLN
ncbi:MAG: penicillin-binding protein 2 [Ignavibacteriaceae bacterium]